MTETGNRGGADEARAFLARAMVFPIVLIVVIAMANGAAEAIGLRDNPALLFAVAAPFSMFWFWLTEIRRSKNVGC